MQLDLKQLFCVCGDCVRGARWRVLGAGIQGLGLLALGHFCSLPSTGSLKRVQQNLPGLLECIPTTEVYRPWPDCARVFLGL